MKIATVSSLVVTGWRLFAVGFTLVNVYPILLQRDTRARIARIASRRRALP
jgi:hypothetical protein